MGICLGKVMFLLFVLIVVDGKVILERKQGSCIEK
jgi:hypothetical protein